MRRGEIWWAALDIPIGSAPGYRRPVIVVSSNTFNDSGLGTVLTVPLTRNLVREALPGNVRVPAHETGLTRQAVALTIQVGPTDKRCLIERIGRTQDVIMNRIDTALRLVLAL